jgi:LacI family transcriptional regulator, galactose operon repressor
VKRSDGRRTQQPSPKRIRALEPYSRDDDRRPSISDVARAAGVSNATVSRVVNGADGFSEATGVRVRAAVKKLNYRPSLAGSALRSGRNPIVALMLTDLTHAYSGAVAASVEDALRRRGKTMVLCNTKEDPGRQDELLLELRAHLVCGIVLLGAVASPGLEQALRLGEPIVFLVRRPPGGLAAPFVGIDDRKAGREIADYFLERGFQDCLLVHGPLSSSATADRVRGFRERFREAGLCKRAVRAFAVPSSRKEAGYARAHKLLNDSGRPQAIFCTTDEIAFGVARRCFELGLDLTRDVTLFGFDGNPLNEFLAPWLSTIGVPFEGFGAAVGSIFDRIWSDRAKEHSDTVILPYHMVIAAARSDREAV